MEKETSYILHFKDVTLKDVPYVGGKNAALGEMISGIVPMGINVPEGFAITAHAYRHFLKSSGLEEKIKKILSDLDTNSLKNLQKHGKKVRSIILKAKLPQDLEIAIRDAYMGLGDKAMVAVRSSATAEDLPGASFAGQQETYLNVVGLKDVLESTKKCIASLFTDRAISYRQDKGFSHFDVALSLGVQRMVKTDTASSGVMFTIDTESGFEKLIVINSSYGLGEYVVQGTVTPDEFIVFKPLLADCKRPIISKKLGAKSKKLARDSKGNNVSVEVSLEDRNKFSLSDDEILQLAKWGKQIEEFFSGKYDRLQPMDIEWGKDGDDGQLYILQARPETVHSVEGHVTVDYRLKEKGEKITEGAAVGSKIAVGKARVIEDVKDIGKFKKDEILVTQITDPDWEPIMKIASAIITDKGGRTSHAAIVSRELGIPCIVGTETATQVLKTGEEVTVDCASGDTGMVYRGKLDFEKEEHKLDKIPELKTKIMLNIGTSDEAFRHWRLPVQGVGLGRLEFIIASHIQAHPRALMDLEKIKAEGKHPEIAAKLEKISAAYEDKSQYYVDTLAQGMAKIAATFYPHPVIIRFSDFKTNEYRTLLGGELYEPEEENPMIGWRGASRYYHPDFKEAFGLEVKAMKKAREEMGLNNIIPMIPFCRTVEEGEKVVEVMKVNGLDREKDPNLKIYVMCEIPANIILVDEFLEVFDGYSIGSNDLSQLTLGLDRDSAIVAKVGNENNEAVKKSIAQVIKKVKEKGKYIGICGQAPSDYPDFAQFLVDQDIDSMSLSPDTVIRTIKMVAEKEKSKK